MKTSIAAVLMLIAAYPARAQHAATESSVSGIWKGSSLCQVKNSPCHDETVVYYITQTPGTDSFHIAANKIVNGKEEEMGIIGCIWDGKNNRLLSTSFNGQWTFNFKDTNLDGTLYYKGDLFRVIKLVKQK